MGFEPTTACLGSKSSPVSENVFSTPHSPVSPALITILPVSTRPAVSTPADHPSVNRILARLRWVSDTPQGYAAPWHTGSSRTSRSRQSSPKPTRQSGDQSRGHPSSVLNAPQRRPATLLRITRGAGHHHVPSYPYYCFIHFAPPPDRSPQASRHRTHHRRQPPGLQAQRNEPNGDERPADQPLPSPNQHERQHQVGAAQPRPNRYHGQAHPGSNAQPPNNQKPASNDPRSEDDGTSSQRLRYDFVHRAIFASPEPAPLAEHGHIPLAEVPPG